jgi:hypothetical protein
MPGHSQHHKPPTRTPLFVELRGMISRNQILSVTGVAA